MTQADILTLLRQISEEYKSNTDQIYNESVALVQYSGVQKNIEF